MPIIPDDAVILTRHLDADGRLIDIPRRRAHRLVVLRRRPPGIYRRPDDAAEPEGEGFPAG